MLNIHEKQEEPTTPRIVSFGDTDMSSETPAVSMFDNEMSTMTASYKGQTDSLWGCGEENLSVGCMSTGTDSSDFSKYNFEL